MADKRRLTELGMPSELAKEVAAQIGAAPTSTARGGVLQQAAQANSAASDVAGVNTQFNALLAKLRAAGVIAAS